MKRALMRAAIVVTTWLVIVGLFEYWTRSSAEYIEPERSMPWDGKKVLILRIVPLEGDAVMRTFPAMTWPEFQQAMAEVTENNDRCRQYGHKPNGEIAIMSAEYAEAFMHFSDPESGMNPEGWPPSFHVEAAAVFYGESQNFIT